MIAAARKAPYIGGSSHTIEVSDHAIVVIEFNNGHFITMSPKAGQKVHLITPLVATGKIKHEGEMIEYICAATPDAQAGMTMSQYPKLLEDAFAEKIRQKAIMCAPQLFARMHEVETVADTQTTEYRNLPYTLTYKFSVASETETESA